MNHLRAIPNFLLLSAATFCLSLVASDVFACTQYFMFSTGRYQKISGRVTLLSTSFDNTARRNLCMDISNVISSSGAASQETCGCIDVPSAATDTAVLGKTIVYRNPGRLTVVE